MARRRSPPERDHAAILAKLDAVEAEMKRIGYWTDDPPEGGVEGNFVTAPSFELWLQCTFLPNAREAARSRVYPDGKSMVGLASLRQYDYHSCIPEAHPLMRLLHEFDDLVNAGL